MKKIFYNFEKKKKKKYKAYKYGKEFNSQTRNELLAPRYAQNRFDD